MRVFVGDSRERGVTLVELIISIVIIAVALSGVLMVINQTTSHSVDPMLQHQAVAIAESYLEEVLLHPCGPDTTPVHPGGRATFDNVADYNNLPDAKVRDQNGALIGALDPNYSVTVTVAADNLGPAGNQVSASRVTVTVSGQGTNFTLRGWCVDY
ncbi:hypothetical protein DESUT3_34660 [Desulfuromonas versatilis]|uniref:Type II secretion system protein n=1 Tax=Desulfuromonas versatilis TaxID=2802975 RepID=A0ABN6E2I1_9BACT|nr:prepilin-type N-terminal cleavage/methylation domain-containing protein [Desulfuromonas versatilis]BCR06397.1 hypothetical protein DESUT3_34660 [Desulfuromonas versatilis]